VWPDTFVEESNLAYHVFALRKALGETGEAAKFIETVPKRGYRFTAAVTVIGNGHSAHPTDGSLEPDHQMPSEVRDGEPIRVVDGRGVAAPPLSPRRWAWLGVPIAVLVIAPFGALSSRGLGDPAPPRAVPLTSLPGVVRSPSLSPNGTHVAFTWNGERQDNPDLYVQQIGTGGPLRLTNHPGNDYSPSWSPDGRTIAFLRRGPDGQNTEVWLIAPLGGFERKLADIQPQLPAYRPLSVGWCPDSRCVVATDSAGDGKADAIFSIAIGSGEKRQLTHPNGLVADADPSISPDGRYLVFRRDTTPFSGAIYLLTLKGGAPDGDSLRLTPTLSAGRPTWMPDSREILFAARGALWRLSTSQGRPPTRLAFVGQDGSSPVVSRTSDGRHRLLYVRSFSDRNIWRVATSEASAGPPSVAELAIGSTRSDSIPNLSPDERRLAFVSDRSGESHVWAAETSGADATQITSLTFSSGPGFPRWSPDRSLIAFHGDPEGRPDVLVVAASGGLPRVLTKEMPNGGFPSFSRDGNWIYFTVLEAGEPRIWKIPTSGGVAVQVTQNAGTLAIESYDGRDLYYVAAVERPSSLWRLRLGEATSQKILDGIVLGNFDVAEAGIYYMDRVKVEAGGSSTDPTGGETRLQYFDFSTSRSRTVARQLGNIAFGLSASRDGRSVFFSRVDSSIDELILVDGLR
jgi:Tol biopolymer transport system component